MSGLKKKKRCCILPFSPILPYPLPSFSSPTMPPTPTCAALPAGSLFSECSSRRWSRRCSAEQINLTEPWIHTQVIKNRCLQATAISPTTPSASFCAFHSRNFNVLSPRRENIDILSPYEMKEVFGFLFNP